METSKELRLSQVEVGSTVEVLRVEGKGPIKRHILDMGLTKGTQVFVRKLAPLGDPLEVCIRDYELSLRASEAESVLVRVL